MIWETYDIYKDERIPKSVDNQCFISFKICNICPNNAFLILKNETCAIFKPKTYRLLSYPLTGWATWKSIKLLRKIHYHCLIRKEIHHIIEVCHSPLSLFQMFVWFHPSRICLHSLTRLHICFASVWNDKA